ncbi:MAG: hypothetical protein ACYSWP_07265 [Planctomycetota bacterium]|jgi:hypothetical protein
MPTIERKDGVQPPRGQSKEPRHDKVLMGPGEYEVTRQSKFTIEIHLKTRSEEDNWWIIANKEEAVVTEKVVFRMWTYDEMVEMRKLSTKYDQMRRVHMIDHDVLNRLKIQRFLMSWTFDKNNPRLELHHQNGVLVDEAWAKVKLLQPNILKHMIDEMNERYEFGY